MCTGRQLQERLAEKASQRTILDMQANALRSSAPAPARPLSPSLAHALFMQIANLDEVIATQSERFNAERRTLARGKSELRANMDKCQAEADRIAALLQATTLTQTHAHARTRAHMALYDWALWSRGACSRCKRRARRWSARRRRTTTRS